MATRAVVAAVAGSLLSVGAAGSAPATAASVNPPAFWYKLNGHPTDAEITKCATSCRVVVMHAWEKAAAARLKSLNPSITVLVYKDLSATNSNPDTVVNGKDISPLATGVGYAEASAHPEWFALDSYGKRIPWNGYPGLWQMAVWNTGYQQRWVDNVTRELAGSPFDGVFGDDALVTLKWYSSATMPGAPTDAALQAAERALISKASAGLHAIGKKLVLNIGSATAYPAVWHDWVNLADGGMIEHFVHYGGDENDPDNYQWDWGSSGWRALGPLLNDGAVNVAVANSYPNQRRGYLMGLSSFWVLGGGRGAFQAAGPDDYRYLDIRPEMAWDLGTPLGAMVKTGSAYTRTFSAGFAAVNPSATATTTVQVPAGMVDAGGATVSSLTLGPLRGMVLRSAAPAEKPAEPVAEKPADPVAEPVTEPVAEPVVEPVKKTKGSWRHHAPAPVAVPVVTAPVASAPVASAPAASAGTSAAAPATNRTVRPVTRAATPRAVPAGRTSAVSLGTAPAAVPASVPALPAAPALPATVPAAAAPAVAPRAAAPRAARPVTRAHVTPASVGIATLPTVPAERRTPVSPVEAALALAFAAVAVSGGRRRVATVRP